MSDAPNNIRHMLDLSTAHLPEELGRTSEDMRDRTGLPGVDGVIAYKTAFGFLVWVPDDVDEHASDYDDIPETVLAVLRYARARDCDYILFDADGPVDANLPTWEW